MKPWIELGRATPEGGGVLSLHRRDTEYVIRVDGEELMSSRRHGSEERLAELGCIAVPGTGAPRVLVGGLGMGFTLRAALGLVPADAKVVVAELAAIVVEWNRGPLADLAARPLEDARVEVRVLDVATVIREARPASYDAILLDVDNGPRGLVHPDNEAIYGRTGLARARRALKSGGRLAVWSAARDPRFASRLAGADFHHEVHHAPARGSGGGVHAIYVGRVR